MNKISSFSYFLRKSPVVRTGGWICAALLFVIVSVIFGMRIQQKPEIESIVPPVGSPGDLIIITGRDFGAVRDTSLNSEEAALRQVPIFPGLTLK